MSKSAPGIRLPGGANVREQYGHLLGAPRQAAAAGMDNVERLEREIRNQAGIVRNGVDMRRHHPSFGYTKGHVRAQFHQLEGMLMAWVYVTGRWDHSGRPGEPTIEQFMSEFPWITDGTSEVSLSSLRADVEKS